MTVEHCRGTSAFASDRQISECSLPKEAIFSEHKQVILGMLTNGHCCCFFW